MISLLVSIFLSSLRFEILKIFFTVLDHLLAGLLFVWGLLPWYEAYIYAAFEMYTKTSLYRDRITAFNQEFAISSYLGEGAAIGDSSLFKSKVRKDKKLMLRIIFAPYSLRPTEVLI